MLENFILYFYLLKQTYLYFFFIFLFEHTNKKKKIQTDGKNKNKIIGSRLLGFFRRCEKKPLAHFQRSCPK
jgi:hypothetical protein